VQVIVINLRYVRIGYYYERQIPESLNSMCKADWEEGKGKVGGGEESGSMEWWPAMSVRIISREILNLIITIYLTRSARLKVCNGLLARLATSSSEITVELGGCDQR
jgi:hypothetical protein